MILQPFPQKPTREDEADALWICDLARTRRTNGAQTA